MRKNKSIEFRFHKLLLTSENFDLEFKVGLKDTDETKYCKTLNICGIKISRFNKNEILAYFNFGGYDTLMVPDNKANLI